MSAWVAKSSDGPVVYGIVLAPGASVDGKTITADAVEKAAHAWMADASSVAKSASGGRVVSSMCAMTDMKMFDEQGQTHAVAKGAWVVGVKTDDASLLRQARSGELSFQPMLTADASVGTAISARIRKEEAPPMTDQTAYEAIKKAAAAERREGETIEQATSRVASQRPDLFRNYRESESPAPIQKSSTQATAERRIEEAVRKEMGIDPSLTKEQALVRVTEGKEGRKLMAEYRDGREATLKAANAVPVDVDLAKVEAHRWLRSEIVRVMDEKHIGEPEASVMVVKSEEGQKRYQVMLGVTAPVKPEVTVSKADVPFERIRAIARTMLSDGKVKTLAQGVAKAASENPDLYREYREAMDAEAQARAQQSASREPSQSQAPIGKAEPYHAIEALAEGIRKSDPTLTRETAIIKAAESRPDLYRLYRAAKDAEMAAQRS